MTATGTARLIDAETPARLAWVDVAKGICILLVVMMHSTLGTGATMGGEGFLHGVVAFAQPFRIPAFFLLSGLFLGRVIDRDWRHFADRRLVHFAYFYALWVVIQSLAKYGQIAEGAGSEAFLAHLATALVEPYSTLWFIYLLAVFSVVTKLLRRVPQPILLLAAALIQIVPVTTPSTLVEEFCARYVWFVVGFVFADQVFAFAGIVRRHPIPTLAGLALWAVIDGALALTPSGFASFPTLAGLPGVSMVLGGAGALAIVAVASLLTRADSPLTGALRLCGERSIVIYLSFFLPMAATRAVLVKSDVLADIGWASLVVMAAAATTPLVFERLIRHTRLAFLFQRPRAFHIVRQSPTSSGSVLQVA